MIKRMHNDDCSRSINCDVNISDEKSIKFSSGNVDKNSEKITFAQIDLMKTKYLFYSEI